MAIELVESGTGLELIQLEVGKILYENINEIIDYYQELWQERDADWQSLTGQSNSGIVVEHIPETNIYLGHRPSLILESQPKEAYPNLAVMAYESRTSDQIIDQASNSIVNVDIEIMVKSETSEVEADRRVHRTLEAVHQVLVRNHTLNGKTLGWDNDPTVSIGDIFIRREELSYGDEWYWQGGSMRYIVNRSTNLLI